MHLGLHFSRIGSQSEYWVRIFCSHIPITSEDFAKVVHNPVMDYTLKEPFTQWLLSISWLRRFVRLHEVATEGTIQWFRA